MGKNETLWICPHSILGMEPVKRIKESLSFLRTRVTQERSNNIGLPLVVSVLLAYFAKELAFMEKHAHIM